MSTLDTPTNMWDGVFCYITMNGEERYRCIMCDASIEKGEGISCIKSECGRISRREENED